MDKTRLRPSRRAPSLIEPASARAQRPQRRGPTGRLAARRRLPASPREPPAFRRGDRVVRRFAHAPRLRGALASPAPSPCSHAPAPCGHALGRATGHSGSPQPQCTALPPPSGARRARLESGEGETSRPPPSLDLSVRSKPGVTLRSRVAHSRGGTRQRASAVGRSSPVRQRPGRSYEGRSRP